MIGMLWSFFGFTTGLKVSASTKFANPSLVITQSYPFYDRRIPVLDFSWTCSVVSGLYLKPDGLHLIKNDGSLA